MNTDRSKRPPTIHVNLDRPRTMILDANALVEIEEATGKSIMQGQLKGLNASDLRAIFFACLKHEDPELTLEQVGAWLLPGHFPEAVDIVLRLIMAESDPKVLAPFVASPAEVVEAALELAQVGAADVLYDLGCGEGNVLCSAVKRGARAIGIENDAARATAARGALLSLPGDLSKRGEVREGLIQDADLSKASVVFVYLLTTSNTKLRPKLEQSLGKGTRVVSHDFPFAGWTVDKECSVFVQEDGRTHMLYLYVHPGAEALGTVPEAQEGVPA